MNIICFNFKDVDECVEGSHDCFPNFATCVNIPGSYNCVCSHSYTEDNTCLPEGTSCSELNCALATSCKDIFCGICIRKSDSNLIIDWHCICWFCDNSRWMYMVHSHAILPAPSPYFSFKAVSKPLYAIIFQSFQSASFSIAISYPIIEFDVWCHAIFSKH